MREPFVMIIPHYVNMRCRQKAGAFFCLASGLTTGGLGKDVRNQGKKVSALLAAASGEVQKM